MIRILNVIFLKKFWPIAIETLPSLPLPALIFLAMHHHSLVVIGHLHNKLVIKLFYLGTTTKGRFTIIK